MDVFKKKKRSWIMSRVKTRATKPELIVRKLIRGLGYEIKINVDSLPGKPDIVLFDQKKVLFVNGCFWHGHKKCKRSKMPMQHKAFWMKKIGSNIARDKRNKMALKKSGFKVETVWQCEIKDMGGLKKKLAGFLEEAK